MQKKVLIIEDNKDLQEIYKINFESENFFVKISDDGMKGIIELLNFKPDIVILDIMMPNMNGFEVLKTIKNQSSIRIPIIVCSNLTSQNDEKKAIEYGATLYLKKSDYDGEDIVKKSIELLN